MSGLGPGGPVWGWPEWLCFTGCVWAREQGSCRGGILKYKLSLQTGQLFRDAFEVTLIHLVRLPPLTEH